MEHRDHVRLLAGGVPPPAPPLSRREAEGQTDAADGPDGPPGSVWADLGSGTGAFTLALAELLGPGGQIYSVDRDASALRVQAGALRAAFPGTVVHYLDGDFRGPLDLPPLDGILMANSLHFVPQKEPVVRRLAGTLKPGGRFILVEYNSDRGNPWVPYPLSYPAWERLASRSGLRDTTLLATHPSRFLSQIYSALSWK